MSLGKEGPGTAINVSEANSIHTVGLLNPQEPNISKSSPTNAPSPSLTQTLWNFRTPHLHFFLRWWYFLPKNSQLLVRAKTCAGPFLILRTCWYVQVIIQAMAINSYRRLWGKCSPPSQTEGSSGPDLATKTLHSFIESFICH